MNKLFKYLLLSTIIFVGGALEAQSASDVTAIAVVGKSATITVTNDGTQPFTYQWSKDGTNISGGTGTATDKFIINPITLASAGTYKVVVSNSAGSVTSPNAILKVMAPPVILTHPSAVAVQIGKPASFTALANSSPAPTYQWLKNGTPIAGATAATYNIAAVTAADAGNYSCVATSTLDTLVMTATTNVAALTVTAAPPTITGITITIQ